MASGAGGVPMPYQPTKAAQGQQDSNIQGVLNTAYPYSMSLANDVIPSLKNETGQIPANPWRGLAEATAYSTMGLGTPVAEKGIAAANTGFDTIMPQQMAASQQMYGLGNFDLSFAAPFMQQAFDPQQQMYDRTLKQTTDYQNAINAEAGVAGSPYGAGLTGDAQRNFQIDWQNSQLQRMMMGLQGLGSINQTAGGAFGMGSELGTAALNTGASSLNLGGQAADMYNTLGRLPYDTHNNIIGNNISALNALSQGTSAALAPGFQTAAASEDYLGTGQKATQIAQAGQKQKFDQNAQTMAGIGKLAGSAVSLASNPFSMFGTQLWG